MRKGSAYLLDKLHAVNQGIIDLQLGGAVNVYRVFGIFCIILATGRGPLLEAAQTIFVSLGIHLLPACRIHTIMSFLVDIARALLAQTTVTTLRFSYCEGIYVLGT